MEPTAALKKVLEDLCIFILPDLFLCQIEGMITLCYVEMLEKMLMMWPSLLQFYGQKIFPFNRSYYKL